MLTFSSQLTLFRDNCKNVLGHIAKVNKSIRGQESLDPL